MPAKIHTLWDDRFEQLQHLPDNILFDMARNESAAHNFRLFAVELLVVRKSPRIKHPDIRGLVEELEIELDGIEFEHPAPGPGPMVASVTTATMWAEPPQKEEPDA
jgi:hypothetical protein